jgi:N-acetyl-gamma-glutamyl-phosphate reductase
VSGPTSPLEARATAVASPARVPAVVLGGSGYVAGELLRLLAGHPGLAVAGAVSESRGGELVGAAFPHLAGAYPGVSFAERDELPRLLDGAERTAVFCAAPHGAAAPLVDGVLSEAARLGVAVAIVDLSADFRFPTAALYESIYRHPHPAPARLDGFLCALPEHAAVPATRAVAHPGCFTTAFLLAAVPLLAGGHCAPRLHVAGVTGSTGAGRTPGPTTHHPERRSTMFAYQPLAHRHAAEMRLLASAAASTAEPRVHFVAHAGPFARGIHLTAQAELARAASRDELLAVLRDAYAAAPFVDVVEAPPRLQEVVGSNRCRLSLAVDEEAVAVMAVIDNLVKGAAGGAVQWMNRLLGLPETAGLLAPGLGWL